MIRKCKLIKEIYENKNVEKNKNIMIFTKGFKAIGEYYTENEIRGIITIKNVRIYSYATNCECETTPEYNEVSWLNVFGIDIIAFSFVQ